MERFVVSYTTPDPSRPQPASPILLDPAYVYYQIETGQSRINLKDTEGQIRELKIVSVRPFLNENGNQTHYELFVL